MKKMLTNKEASAKQEKMIADYLGWYIVPGSGSRHNYPGDIYSDEWLGECKTHLTETNKIAFHINHWNKICNEAISQFKTPVLFVDNGSRGIKYTLCLLKPNFEGIFKINNSPNIKINKSSITVSIDAIDELKDENSIITFKIDNIEYGITTLENLESFLRRY